MREGLSSEIYSIISLGLDSATNSLISIDSYTGITLYPKVFKNPGKEQEDVLAIKSKSMFDGLKQL